MSTTTLTIKGEESIKKLTSDIDQLIVRLANAGNPDAEY